MSGFTPKSDEELLAIQLQQMQWVRDKQAKAKSMYDAGRMEQAYELQNAAHAAPHLAHHFHTDIRQMTDRHLSKAQVRAGRFVLLRMTSPFLGKWFLRKEMRRQEQVLQEIPWEIRQAMRADERSGAKAWSFLSLSLDMLLMLPVALFMLAVLVLAGLKLVL